MDVGRAGGAGVAAGRAGRLVCSLAAALGYRDARQLMSYCKKQREVCMDGPS